MQLSAVTPRSRHSLIVDEIGAAILRGEITGALPVEDDLCAQLNISRGALREAIKALVAKGLLFVGPRIGTRVADPELWNRTDPDVVRWWWQADPDSVGASVLEVRTLLEPHAAARASRVASVSQRERLRDLASQMGLVSGRDFVSLDVEFHITLWRASGNPVIGSMGVGLSSAFQHVFACSSARGRTAAAARLHLELADRVSEGDADGSQSSAAALLKVSDVDFKDGRAMNA